MPITLKAQQSDGFVCSICTRCTLCRTHIYVRMCDMMPLHSWCSTRHNSMFILPRNRTLRAHEAAAAAATNISPRRACQSDSVCLNLFCSLFLSLAVFSPTAYPRVNVCKRLFFGIIASKRAWVVAQWLDNILTGIGKNRKNQSRAKKEGFDPPQKLTSELNGLVETLACSTLCLLLDTVDHGLVLIRKRNLAKRLQSSHTLFGCQLRAEKTKTKNSNNHKRNS